MNKNINPIEVAKWGAVLLGGFLLFKVLRGTGLLPDKTEQKANDLNNSVTTEKWTNSNFWKLQAPAGYQSMAFTVVSTDNLITALWDSTGTFNDDEEKMQGTLRQINYKSQYSWLAYKFYEKYGKDLTGYLKDAFSAEELYPVWSYLNTLPTYKKIN